MAEGPTELELHWQHMYDIKDDIIFACAVSFGILTVFGFINKVFHDWLWASRVAQNPASSGSIYLAMTSQQQWFYISYYASGLYSLVLTGWSYYGLMNCDLPASEPDQSHLAFGNTAFRHEYCMTHPNDAQLVLNFVMITIMVYDLLVQVTLVRDFKSSGALSNYFHHVLVIWGCSSGLGLGRYWLVLGNISLMSEASTPFVNIRYLLHTHKKASGSAYFYNGLVMTGTFFLVRPVALGICICCLIPLMMKNQDVSRDSTATYYAGYFVTATFPILWLLNMFWFKKMLMGAIKVLTAPKTPKTAEDPKKK